MVVKIILIREKENVTDDRFNPQGKDGADMNTMIIKRLVVCDGGCVYDRTFDDGWNTLDRRRDEAIVRALPLIVSRPNARGDPWPDKVMAAVDVGDPYYVCVNGGKMTVMKPRGDEECTAEYCRLLATPEEYAANIFESSSQQDYPERMASYKEWDRRFTRDELRMMTDGSAHTHSFRHHLRRFIEEFETTRLVDGKPYWLRLDSDGRFTVTVDDGEPDGGLSETEQMVYRYRCFLSLAEFWSEFETVRNLNYIKKPFLVTGLCNRIDQSVDLSSLFRKTQDSGRQVFMVC